jgi:hypothetical protein
MGPTKNSGGFSDSYVEQSISWLISVPNRLLIINAGSSGTSTGLQFARNTIDVSETIFFIIRLFYFAGLSL